MKRVIPTIYGEQLFLKELPQEKVKIFTSQSIKISKETIIHSNREILSRYPSSLVKETIQRKMISESENTAMKDNPLTSHILRLVPFAAILLVLFISLPLSKGTIRSKGIVPELSIYIEKSNGPEKLSNDDHVAEHDLIQLTYNAAGHKYGVIFSIDSRGILTLHYPESIIGEPVLIPDGNHALPFSYELDDAPRFERFFFISSNQDFNVGSILKEAEHIGTDKIETTEKLHLPRRFDQQTIILRKEF